MQADADTPRGRRVLSKGRRVGPSLCACGTGLPRELIRCRLGLFFGSRGHRCAAPLAGLAPGSALERPIRRGWATAPLSLPS
jgi:hypothetical protein